MTVEIVSPEGTDPQRGELAFAQLRPELVDRLDLYGEIETLLAGDVIYRAGHDRPDLFLVVSGTVELVGYRAGTVEPQVLARYGVGGIGGELAVLNGQKSFVTSRAAEDTIIRRFAEPVVRRLMSNETELSDVLLRMFIARRDLLRTGVTSQSIEIIGDAHSRDSLALRSYAARQGIPHRWFEVESDVAQHRLKQTGLSAAALPLVYSARGIFPNTTPGELAEALGMSYPSGARDVDLLVIGAGPAGMAAAVYGASEGLETVVLDAVAVGGQAAASARIENYLGFSSGISGAALLEQSTFQAEKFGAQIYTPCRVTSITAAEGALSVELSDGTSIAPRAVIIATGARYRPLALDRWEHFETTSIFYAATDIEVQSCAGQPVVIVGGANSAGQAALHLANAGNQVTVVVRGEVSAKMSSYLAERLAADPGIEVLEHSEVTALHGDDRLTGVTVSGLDRDRTIVGTALFCFAGATPASEWIEGLATDGHGFLLTDTDIPVEDRPEAWTTLGRPPLPFETSAPLVFAVGDVRHGSMKRVAAAVGEGASAVHSVHRAIGWT